MIMIVDISRLLSRSNLVPAILAEGVNPEQEARENVERGFALITAYYEGSLHWMNRIKFSSLRISDAGNCVLRQVFGNYELGLSKLGMYSGSSEVTRHGFCTDHARGLDDDVLREAWRDKVLTELAA